MSNQVIEAIRTKVSQARAAAQAWTDGQDAIKALPKLERELAAAERQTVQDDTEHLAADDKLCADYISTGKGVDAAIDELVTAAVASVEAGRRFIAHTKRKDIPPPGSATMALMHVIARHLHKAGVPNIGASAILSDEYASYSKRLPAPRAAATAPDAASK